MSDVLENLPPAGTPQPEDLLYATQEGNSRAMPVGSLRQTPIRTITASGTLAQWDAYVRVNTASAANLTVPANADVAIAIGSQITVVAVGTGKVTIVAASGVTILTNETLKLRKQGSAVTLTKVGTDAWELAGDVELV